jgi:hypothetical protein
MAKGGDKQAKQAGKNGMPLAPKSSKRISSRKGGK